MKYALVGNPNCGKTTIFNALTGFNQKVGNWSGVTVDKKTGILKSNEKKIEIIDIPGIYSLSVSNENSIDEKIAYSFIINEKPNAIINVVDASNLNRSLYLTIQLIELGIPIILAVNMIDIANKKGIVVHYDKLENILGCKVIPIIASKKIGIINLKHILAKSQSKPGLDLTKYYPKTIFNLEKKILNLLKNRTGSLRITIELLDGKNMQEIRTKDLCKLKKYINKNQTFNINQLRYRTVTKIIKSSIENIKVSKVNITKILDKICMNKYLGVPVFLIMMYLMFLFSITLGSAVQPLFDILSSAIFIDGIAYYSNLIGLPITITDILSKGFGTGINTVLTFIPQLGFLFIFLSILEDSGYMSRAAFIMDKFMQFIGLPGKAFVPLIVGFGCNVASVMASRTLETRKDRLMTIMMSPFMSCGARLAIFSVFATVFFQENRALVIFLLYIIGIIGAILTGYVIKFTFLKGETYPFILDIPQYHLPNAKTIMLYSWNRLKIFLLKAGKVIIPVAIIIGSLNNIYISKDETILSYTSKKITPMLNPIGVSNDNWPATVGLITGTLAKEVVIGTLNTIYKQEDNNDIPKSFNVIDSLKDAIFKTINNFKHIDFKPITINENDINMNNNAMVNMVNKFGSSIAAFSYLLFILLYIPCISVIGATIKEATRGWAILSIIWSTSIAYVAALLVYQIANIINNPIKSIIYIICGIIYTLIIVIIMKYLSNKIIFVANLTGCSSCNTKC